MLCTVNDIRVRLGKIMNVLLDEEINQKYKSVQPLYPEQIGYEFDQETNQLVLDLSENLYDNNYWKEKILSAPPEVFFTFIIRYHIISSALSNREQSLPANVPEQDSDFFVVLMNQLWKSL